MNTAAEYVAALDEHARLQHCSALALMVRDRADYVLVFQSDRDRLTKLSRLLCCGGECVAVLWIDGIVPGHLLLEQSDEVQQVIDRETSVIAELFARDYGIQITN